MDKGSAGAKGKLGAIKRLTSGRWRQARPGKRAILENLRWLAVVFWANLFLFGSGLS